ncbi:MAG TPA: TonB-dependent receptor [Candidatus Ozemobacteraceae bacterium]|nr:TonB-dependent receptor [Candidatus Ozemobacteraceae bacterium]HQG28745.1 TonB-dependent receptor [Candidatus Ozemobacteraceae bacterium]
MKRWRFLCIGLLLVQQGVLAEPQTASGTNAYRLSGLTITAERAGLERWLPATHEAVPTATAQLLYAPTPNDMIRAHPSVALGGSMKGMAAAPSVRGFPNHTTQVLLDGTPVNMPWANWANLTAYPLRGLKNAVLVSGGDGLLYGASGLAGALNLSLPTARDLEGLRMSQEIGNLGVNRREVTYGRVCDASEHLFTWSGNETRGHLENGFKDTDSLMYRGSYSLPQDWRVRTSFLELRGRFGLPNLNDTSMTPQIWDTWNVSHRDLVVEKETARDGVLTLRAFRNAEFSHITDYTDTTYATQKAESTQDMAVTGQELLYTWAPSSDHRLTVGWQGRRDTMDGASTSGHKELDTHGYLLSDIFEIGSNLRLNGTIRRDAHSTADSETSWTGGLTWNPASRWRWNVSRSRVARFPVMRELYMTFMGRQKNDGTWTATVPGQGNPALKAETADTTEGGFAWQFHRDWEISLKRYVSTVEDMIDREFSATWPRTAPRFLWVNRGEVDLSGWETRVQGKLCDTSSLWLGHTRIEKADDTATGLRLDARPSYKLNAGLTWERGRTSGLLFVERLGDAPYVSTGKGQSITTKLPASTRLDLTLRRRITDLMTATLTVNNLTDADIETDTHAVGVPVVYGIPRQAILGLDVRF